MFLDDQIVKMVLENDPLSKDYENQKRLVSSILDVCHTRLSELLREDDSDDNIVPATKKVCNLFDSAVRQLERQGYVFLNMGGFKTYLMGKPEISEILNKLNFK